MNRIAFLKEGLKNLRTTGTVTPSSRFLCQAMLREVDFATSRVLVELGAGNGVITRHILDAMAPDARLLVFEVQPNFCELLRKIDDDRLVVIEDSAEYLPQYLQQYGFEKANHIISAIPFVILPKELATRIVETCRDHLLPGGFFVQMHYSTVLKPLYKGIFKRVRIRFMPLNIPPAFVFVCAEK
ncbi:MAG: methyltransferase [Saprospiraceae bacterium]